MRTGWGKYPNVSRGNRAQCFMGCACPRCQHRDAPLLFPCLLFLFVSAPAAPPFPPQLISTWWFICLSVGAQAARILKDGCGVNKERSFRTLTSLQVLVVGLDRRGWIEENGAAIENVVQLTKLSVLWPGAVGERWWRCHTSLPRTEPNRRDEKETRGRNFLTERLTWPAMQRAEPFY